MESTKPIKLNWMSLSQTATAKVMEISDERSISATEALKLMIEETAKNRINISKSSCPHKASFKQKSVSNLNKSASIKFSRHIGE